MGQRGGARVGAGRPKLGIATTKATIYKSDREIINNYAKSIGVPVNELIHRIFNNEHFEEFFTNIDTKSS